MPSRFTVFLICLVVIRSGSLFAQATPTVPLSTPATHAEPPQLAPVFSDDFSEDSREDYVIEGSVTWQKGKLTLSKDTSLERTIHGGPRVTLTLQVEEDETLEQHAPAELRIWLLLEGATPCYVRFRSATKGTDEQPATIALVDHAPVDRSSRRPTERLREVVVKEKRLEEQEFGKLTLEYRYGLLLVTQKSQPVLTAYIDNKMAMVRACRLQTVAGVHRITAAEAETIRVPVRPTAEDRKKLAALTAERSKVANLARQRKYTEAAAVQTRILEVLRSVVGQWDLIYTDGLIRLAMLHQRSGEYARAESLYERTLDILNEMIGQQHLDYAYCLVRLVDLLKSTGQFDRAIPHARHSFEIRRTLFDERHRLVLNGIQELATLYRLTGDYANAVPLSRKSAEIHKLVFGDQDRRYLTTSNNLANLYRDMGDYARAEPLFRETVAIQKSVRGERNPAYLIHLANLASLYRAMGDYARAESLFKTSVDTHFFVFGDRHPGYLLGLSNLASVCSLMGDYERAESLYKEAVDINKSVYGEQHPNYHRSRGGLATLYLKMGEYSRAEPLIKQSLEVHKSVVGEDHPGYRASLRNLVALYLATGDYARAEPYCLDDLEFSRTLAAQRLRGLSSAQAHLLMDKHRLGSDKLLMTLRRQQKMDSPHAYQAVWNTKSISTRLRFADLASRS